MSALLAQSASCQPPSPIPTIRPECCTTDFSPQRSHSCFSRPSPAAAPTLRFTATRRRTAMRRRRSWTLGLIRPRVQTRLPATRRRGTVARTSARPGPRNARRMPFKCAPRFLRGASAGRPQARAPAERSARPEPASLCAPTPARPEQFSATAPVRRRCANCSLRAAWTGRRQSPARQK